jgi:hypothetical protein
LSALQSNLDELVFARIKFFTSGLPDDHEENIPRGYAGLLGSHQRGLALTVLARPTT